MHRGTSSQSGAAYGCGAASQAPPARWPGRLTLHIFGFLLFSLPVSLPFEMSDAEPVENMYININAEDIARARANGNELLPRWRSKRGTSHVESLHRLTNKLLAGSCMSAELAGKKISQFDTENNIKCGIANRGDTDWGFFRHEKLQYIFDLAARNGFANPLPGFKAIPSDYTSTEQFNVSYIGNLVGVSPESLATAAAAAAAGSASTPEITPSTAHADDEAAGADLDEVAEALQLMAPPPPFSSDDSGEEGPVGDVASMSPVDSTAVPASPALAPPAPPVPASLPMPPLVTAQPAAQALTSSTIPTSFDASSPIDSTAAPTSASLALPAAFVPAALPTPPLAPTPAPVPSRLQASSPSLLPASLQAVRDSSSHFTSSVGAAVKPFGNGSHQRPAAPSLSPQHLAALVLSRSSQKQGGRALCMTDLPQPVRTKAEQLYFSSNIFTYLHGNSADFNLFCGAWNTEVERRIAATTQVVTNLDECLYHKSPGHLKAYHDTVVQRQLLVQTETQALFAGAAAAAASDGRVPASGGVRSGVGSAAAAAAAAVRGSASADDILLVAPTADVATANRAARSLKRHRRQENPSALGAPPLFASSQQGPAQAAAAPPIAHGAAGAASHPAVYQVRLTLLLSA